MGEEETVKVSVTLAWLYTTQHYQATVDSGITVSEWAEMTPYQRNRELDRIYDDVAADQSVGGATAINAA